MLKIAVQAKGRLNEDTMQLLKDAGISVTASKRKLMAQASGFPLEVLYLRDDDIPQAVAMGVADIGIVGLNEISEKQQPVNVVMPLGFGQCRLSIAVPKNVSYTGPEWLEGKRIATSYPVILQDFLDKNGVRAEIHRIEGSVEIAPAVGMADAIFDIVSSGGTLVQNGLVEVERVFHSEAALVTHDRLTDEQLAEVEKLKFRFRSIIDSRGMKYVLMNIPKSRLDSAIAVLPGMRSPTILPLADAEWCSLHVVIREEELWEKIESLKQIGAEGILVLALENMIK